MARTSACPVKFFFEGQEYLYRIVKILSEENRPSRAPTSAQGHDEHAAGKLGKFSIPRESGRANAQQRTRRGAPTLELPRRFGRPSVCN